MRDRYTLIAAFLLIAISRLYLWGSEITRFQQDESYWRSSVSDAYKGDWWQRYFHFYRFGDNSIPPFPILSKPELQVPSGYELIAKFSGDGPEIVVLRRTLTGG